MSVSAWATASIVSTMGWEESYTRLALPSGRVRWDADDLGRLAEAAYMLGRDDEYLRALERAYQAHLDAGAVRAAVRCAFWVGPDACCSGARRRAPTGGSAAPSDCSSASATTAWNAATC